jgi:uncharacterized membrane protein HdeD (DUF308 family)
MSNTVATSLKANGLEPLRSKSGWIVTLGIIYVVAGLIALGSVLMATVVTVFVVGVMMLIAGGLQHKSLSLKPLSGRGG